MTPAELEAIRERDAAYVPYNASRVFSGDPSIQAKHDRRAVLAHVDALQTSYDLLLDRLEEAEAQLRALSKAASDE